MPGLEDKETKANEDQKATTSLKLIHLEIRATNSFSSSLHFKILFLELEWKGMFFVHGRKKDVRSLYTQSIEVQLIISSC